jgi:hypothetical protein
MPCELDVSVPFTGALEIASDISVQENETVAVSEDDLIEAGERAFERSSGHLPSWLDPHPDRQPDDSEYSRVTNAERYRIVGARADAWADAVVQLGLAVTHDLVEWAEPPQTDFRRPFLVVPKAVAALPVVIARHRLGDCDDAGLTLGLGSPALPVGFLPDCGCDACDSGSQDLIDVVDQYFHAIITGRYRRLWQGDKVIEVVGERRSSSNIGWRRADAVLAHPEDWADLTGTSWLTLMPGTTLDP